MSAEIVPHSFFRIERVDRAGHVSRQYNPIASHHSYLHRHRQFFPIAYRTLTCVERHHAAYPFKVEELCQFARNAVEKISSKASCLAEHLVSTSLSIPARRTTAAAAGTDSFLSRRERLPVHHSGKNFRRYDETIPR
jgi:hypothetical protein